MASDHASLCRRGAKAPTNLTASSLISLCGKGTSKYLLALVLLTFCGVVASRLGLQCSGTIVVG
jgi:hypothetical protein